MLSDFNFAGARQINTSGRFFLYYSANNPNGLDERLKVYGDGRYFGTFAPGDYIEELPRDVEAWYIEPVTATMSGTVFVGDAKARSNRLTGTVRIVDESAAKTLAGLQFYGLMRRAVAAGKFSMCGILAGARAFSLKKAWFTAGAAGLGTIVVGTGAPTDTPASLAVRNKQLGGANALATRVSGLAVANNPTVGELPGSDPQASFYINANVLTEMPISNPIVIPAGSFFGIVGPALATEVGMWFDGEELA